MRNFLLVIFCIALQLSAPAQDTGEVRTVEGRRFKVHKVQAGETVYGLSRDYDVRPADILAANPSASQGLDVGQEVLIPVKEEAKDVVIHVVKTGETLFAISKQYDVDIEEIQRLNNMADISLREGQRLIIRQAEEKTTVTKTEQEPRNEDGYYRVGAGETLFAISRKFSITVDEIMEWNKLESPQISLGQQLRVKAPGNGAPEVVADNKKEEKKEPKVEPKKVEEPDVIQDTTPTTTDEFVETVEKGVAELIPDTENTRKYLALHRTVKPGTIIRVRNEMNGREVWARVIGTLPETGENREILVKISKAAFDRLGAMDKKFRVTITYIP